MKAQWKFIGIDLGAESSRCVAAVIKGWKISLAEVYRFKTHSFRTEKKIHWDITAIFDDIVKGLSEAVKEFGPDFHGIAVDTWGVDYVLVGSDGNVAGPPCHYRDNRTDGMMDEAFRIISKDKLYEKTGINPAQYNTLFQLLAEKKEKPDFINTPCKMMLTPDFINYMLSGKIKAEYSIASTTNLCNPCSRNWSWDLIDEFGFPKNIFPEMVKSGTKLGTLLPSIAKRTGLSSDTPVFTAACHDTASAAAAIPASGKNWAFLSSGTWSLIGIELNQPVINSPALKYGFTNEGGAGETTLFMKNIIGLWPVQECRHSWEMQKKNNYSYDEITGLAKNQGLVNAWVDLNDVRFLKPGDMPNKIIGYLEETNQEAGNSIGFITGVILESLAFSYRKAIKEIENITGRKTEILYIVGGGTQNELLTQYTSDATALQVAVGPVEGAVIGNIGVQAVASGAVPDLQEWRRMVAETFGLKTVRPRNADYFIRNEKNFDRILSEIIY